MKYAAFTADAIYGIGATKDEAKAEAAKNVDQHLPAEEIRKSVESMRVMPITDELVKQVDERGGDVPFDIVDGVLTDESDDE